MKREKFVPLLLMIASATVISSPQTPRKTINDASVAALSTWVDAVRRHIPGRADAGVVAVAAFTYEAREDLNTGIELFVAALLGWPYNTDSNKAAETVAALGHAAGKDFLKRAAVLHSDVAAYGDLVPRPTTATRPRRTPPVQELQLGSGGTPIRIPAREPLPPLLRSDPVLLNNDGEIVGESLASWNWPFARSLLDLLSANPTKNSFSERRPPRARDPFVSAWYHSIASYMFARGLYGDATSHLDHASMVLPDDSLVLFDRACYAEILGLPMHQLLVRDLDVRAPATGGATMWPTPIAGPPLRIPPVSRTNADAEELFRRALIIDPSLLEARVRLARLLQLRGRPREALTELAVVFEGKPTGVVAFYAHLFAGRAAEALGDSVEASKQYEKANALFPDAQSAVLALSHAALVQSDVAGALNTLRRLGPRSNDFTADPWWQYHLASGREVDALLKNMWDMVPH